MMNHFVRHVKIVIIPCVFAVFTFVLTPCACTGQTPKRNGTEIQPPGNLPEKTDEKADVSSEKVVRRSCIHERWEGLISYYDFYDDAGKVVKSVESQKFKDQVPNPYQKAASNDMRLAEIKKGRFKLDGTDAVLKKNLMKELLADLPDEGVIRDIKSVSTYDGPFYIDVHNRFLVYGHHIYFLNENEWGPVWAETTIYVYNNLGNQIGKIVNSKYLNSVVISDDGRYLAGEVQSFIAGDGGDIRTDEFTVYDIESGGLIGSVKCQIESYIPVDFGYDDSLFKITIPTGEGGYWRICIDPSNRRFYKKRYNASDSVWQGIKFLQFKTGQTPEGLVENLSEYEIFNF